MPCRQQKKILVSIFPYYYQYLIVYIFHRNWYNEYALLFQIQSYTFYWWFLPLWLIQWLNLSHFEIPRCWLCMRQIRLRQYSHTLRFNDSDLTQIRISWLLLLRGFYFRWLSHFNACTHCDVSTYVVHMLHRGCHFLLLMLLRQLRRWLVRWSSSMSLESPWKLCFGIIDVRLMSSRLVNVAGLKLILRVWQIWWWIWQFRRHQSHSVRVDLHIIFPRVTAS